MKKLLLLFILSSIIVNAYDFSISGEKYYKQDKGNYENVEFTMTHKNNEFTFLMDLILTKDPTYTFSEADYFGNYSPLIKEGNIQYEISNNFKIKGGKIIPKDEIDSKYSMFFSSEEKSSTGLVIEYEDKNFIYKTNWIELNKNSSAGYPDRGLNYKYYGLKLGENWRFGYQDSVVYTNRSFDSDYFLNPIPVYFTQGINNGVNGPSRKNINDNSIMGFCLEFQNENEYFYSQILVDDINANRVFHRERPQNPDKIAFSSGYRKKIENGDAGIYVAGATKYTFEPYGEKGVNTLYGYTYFPETEYKGQVIDFTNNYIGYLYGENNVSIKADFSNEYKNIFLYSYLECIFSGAKSPANPWHENVIWQEGGEGPKLFDEGEVEKTFKLGTSFNMKCGKDEFFGGMEVGKVYNKLELIEVNGQKMTTENSIKIFRPSNSVENILSLSIGYKINF